MDANCVVVVAELHQEEIHGQVVVRGFGKSAYDPRSGVDDEVMSIPPRIMLGEP